MIAGKANNGLQYAVRRSGRAVAYCALSIKCGTRDEGSFHEGIAHFTEHTIFKGTQKRSSTVINGRLDRLGGELNAYTTKEEIVLHATVLKEDLSKAVSLLLELATQATFPEKEIETEKGVVIDEIIQYKDSPADYIYDRFEEMLFEGHPLGRAILGTAASVRHITSDELRRFVGANFTPDRMALTIVADIDEKRMEAEALAMCDKYFVSGSVGMPSQPAGAEAAPVIHHFDTTVDKRHHEVNVIIGGAAPSLYEHDRRIACVLLCNIIGGPASNSILGRVLRERHGWVYAVECSYTQYRNTGLVTIALGCDKSNLERCFPAIRKAVEDLQQKPLSEARLKAARKQLLGQLAVSSDNGETQCLSMGKSLLSYGRIASDEENRNALESITAAQLQDLSCNLWSEQNLSRLILL